MITPKVGKAMAQAVTRHNQKQSNILQVYNKAVEVIQFRQQWPNGHTEIVYSGTLRGRQGKVWLKNVGGWLQLILFLESPNGKLTNRFYSESLTMAVYKPNLDKWSLLIGDVDYLMWNRRVREEMERVCND